MGMGNNPMNGTDPDGGKFFDEYKENADGSLSWVSDLGRTDGLDFVHKQNGTTEIREFSWFVPAGKLLSIMGTPFSNQLNQMDGFTKRGNEVVRMDIVNEFIKGTGAENSLFYGSNYMNTMVGNTSIANEARSAFLNGNGRKVGGDVPFGLWGFLTHDIQGTEQILGQSNFSVYPLSNNRVLMMVNDSKTFNSINPLAKFGDWINNVEDGSNYPRGPITATHPNNWMANTRQTYIWIESMNVLKAKHALYGK